MNYSFDPAPTVVVLDGADNVRIALDDGTAAPVASNVVPLSEFKDERIWQQVMPLLIAIEEEFDSRPATAAELAEDAAIDAQLKAMMCCARVKRLLLRMLADPSYGALNRRDARLKSLLEKDKSLAAW